MIFPFRKIIVEKVERKYAFEYILKRNELIETSPKKESVKFSGSDSCLLFQRFIVLANCSNNRYGDCEEFELWVYLATLFESTSLMSEA